MDLRLSRRQFLATTAVAAGALGASACSHGTGPLHVGGPQDANGLSLDVTSGAVDRPTDQDVSVFEAGIAQRVAFVLAGKSGFLSPGSGQVTLRFGPDEQHFGAPAAVQVYADTGAAASTYLVASTEWAKSGTFWLRGTYQGKTADSPVVVIDSTKARIPYAGQKMPSVATPTFTDSRGVSPICTRYPMCPFHAESLDAYLKADRPLALVFAPRPCARPPPVGRSSTRWSTSRHPSRRRSTSSTARSSPGSPATTPTPPPCWPTTCSPSRSCSWPTATAPWSNASTGCSGRRR